MLNKQLSNIGSYVKRWLTDDEMAAFDTDDIMSVFYEWDPSWGAKVARSTNALLPLASWPKDGPP